MSTWWSSESRSPRVAKLMARHTPKGVEQEPQVREVGLALHAGTHQRAPIVDHGPRRVACDERIPVAPLHRAVEVLQGPPRRVREGGRRRLAGQLVEARERLGVVVGFEGLEPRQQAPGSEEHELKSRSLEAAAAGAVGAGVGPAHQERVGL